jgi:ring-1,2-phenylacetyl-CoA epoxidase subunit PaaC
MRQFLCSVYQFYLYERLKLLQDHQLAFIADKSLKEVTYHLRWSSEWVIRLGQGTEESRARMQKAIDQLWMYTDEMLSPVSYENILPASDHNLIRQNWKSNTHSVLDIAGIKIPTEIQKHYGGKVGKHTSALKSTLAEMQYLQRTYPGMEW